MRKLSAKLVVRDLRDQELVLAHRTSNQLRTSWCLRGWQICPSTPLSRTSLTVEVSGRRRCDGASSAPGRRRSSLALRRRLRPPSDRASLQYARHARTSPWRRAARCRLAWLAAVKPSRNSSRSGDPFSRGRKWFSYSTLTGGDKGDRI